MNTAEEKQQLVWKLDVPAEMANGTDFEAGGMVEK